MPVRVKVHLREVARGVLELCGQPFAVRAEVLLQAELDFCEIFVVHCPWPKGPRAAPHSRVRHIENIAQPGRVAAVVHERNALCPAPHISPHASRPHVVFCTRRSVGALGVDKNLVSEAVLVVARHGAKQSRPFVVAVRAAAERVMCERGDAGYLVWRGLYLLPMKNARGGYTAAQLVLTFSRP